jgi:chromate transporter
MKPSLTQRLLEVFAVFFKLGAISFGGPAAHIALMERELVQKKQWLDRQTFLDLVSLSQLIPGPNSTELAIHIGYKRAGWLGLIVAGIAFIVPAMLIVLALAILYVKYATLPQMENIFYGIQPVIVAIIAQAVWLLAKMAIKDRALALLACLSFILIWLGLQELIVLVGAGIVYLLWKKYDDQSHRLSAHPSFFLFFSVNMLNSTAHDGGTGIQQMFWTFLKIGAVLYGSGYVLVAYLQSDFVERTAALEPQQLLDAITVGQFTPGPLFTTATFIGYILHGLNGAWLATLAIFLPAFLFVALIAPWSAKLRQHRALSFLLDGINVASLAFLAWVACSFAVQITSDVWQIVLALISLFLLIKYNWNSVWFVLVGGIFGLIFGVFLT